MQMQWEAVSAISSAVATVFLVVAALIALRQWRDATAASQLQSTLAFIDQFQPSSVRGTRDFLRRHRSTVLELLGQPEGLDKLDAFLRLSDDDEGPRSLLALRKDMAAIEFVAVLSMNGRIPQELERSYLAPTIVNYWEAVWPVVRAIRANRGYGVHLQHLEALVNIINSGDIFTGNCRQRKKLELQRIMANAQAATSINVNRQRSPEPPSASSSLTGPSSNLGEIYSADKPD
jgi:hypothetical protein